MGIRRLRNLCGMQHSKSHGTGRFQARHGRDAGVVPRQGSRGRLNSSREDFAVSAEADRAKDRQAPAECNTCNREDGGDATGQGSA
jgi:hypothetical protein